MSKGKISDLLLESRETELMSPGVRRGGDLGPIRGDRPWRMMDLPTQTCKETMDWPLVVCCNFSHKARILLRCDRQPVKR